MAAPATKPPPGTTAVAKTGPKPGFSLQIQTVQDLMLLADVLYRGGAKDLPGFGNPAAVAGVILAGNEIGLSPAQSVDTIMLCNGKRTIYGDGAMALVLASGLLERISEFVEGDGDDMVARAIVKRVGFPEETWVYTAEDAKTAELWNGGKDKKKKNWILYPKDMLTNRCRSRWMKGRFADVLRGLTLQEVAIDEVPVQVVQVQVDAPRATLPASPPPPVPVAEASVSTVEPKQLAAATHTAAEEQAGQPVGDSADPSGGRMAAFCHMSGDAPPAVDPNGPVTHDQLKEIAHIKDQFLNGLDEKSPTIRNGKWVELLQAGYGVNSARNFTAAQAAQFIASEGEKYDPFGHLSTGSRAA